MLKSAVFILFFFLSLSIYSRDKLYAGYIPGKKIFVEIRDDSTATVLIVCTNKVHGCTQFLSPLERISKMTIYNMKFSEWGRNYWITNFSATKKTESINDVSEEKVEFGKKGWWFYVYNLPECPVQFPLRKVSENSDYKVEFERLLSKY